MSAWDEEEAARVEATTGRHSDERLLPGELATSAIDATTGADAVVLTTAWSSFRRIDWVEVAAAMTGRLVIDGRNALDPDEIREAGLEYEGTGRQSRGLTRPLPDLRQGDGR